jgi:RNA polymerase sigma factor (sigma-70 family)
VAEAEAVLLRRFTTAGDAEAFAEIIRRHAGLVYGAAMRILADVDRAADVTQETFLQLTKDASRVSGSLPGWLHRVATHKAIDQMRREAARRRHEVQYAAGQPHEVNDWKDLSHCVDEELNRLDDQTREVLIAHFLEGCTTRQIAAAQGTSQATVSRRVDAGVTRLRVALRRRGLLVAAGALGAMLGENAAQAAPPAVMMELGKLALVGAPGAASAGASAIQAVTGGLLAGVKAKVVVVAAVAVIGAGSVVTYQHAARSRSSENTVITRSPVPRASSRMMSRSSSVSSVPAPGVPAARAGPSTAAQQWSQLINMARRQAAGPGSPQTAPRTPAVSTQDQTPVPDAYGMAMMGGGAASPSSTGQQTTTAGMGGVAFYGTPATPQPQNPNDVSIRIPPQP